MNPEYQNATGPDSGASEELSFQIADAEHDSKPVAVLRVTVMIALGVTVAGTWLLSWLAEEMLKGHTQLFDAAVRAWVHRHASPALTSAAFFASFVGDRVLVAGLVVALLAFYRLRWRRAAVWLMVTMGGALVLDLAMKYGFHRSRPAPFFGPVPLTYSFPSGHSLFSFCFYGVMAGLLADRVNSRSLQAVIWITAAGIITAIGFSRIYLGVHYPSDVLAGYLAAAVWVASIIVLDHMRIRRKASVHP